MTVTPTPSIAALPTAPSRQRPGGFSNETDAFLAAMDAFGDDLEAVAEAAEDNATAAEAAAVTATAQAAAAAVSAASALNSAATQATSTTSLTIGTGEKSLTLAQTGKAFALFQRVQLAASASAYVIGRITAFDAGTGAMTVDATTAVGSGTFEAWTVSPAGPEALAAASAAAVRAGTASDLAVTPAALAGSAAFQVLTDAATIAWNAALGFNARVTLTANRTMGEPTNLQDGLTYALAITQDGTGSRTLSWNAVFDWGDVGAPTLSTAAGRVDFAFGIYSATTGKLHMSFRRGGA